MYIGKCSKINNVSYEYKKMAEMDEMVANELFNNMSYRHAIYFYIQSMEKYIKAKIFSIVNPKIDYYIKRVENHSLDYTVNFLIELINTNDIIKEQIKRQLREHVLKGIRFNTLHNDLRYPKYSTRKQTYMVFVYNKSDCIEIRESVQLLKKFLEELNRF